MSRNQSGGFNKFLNFIGIVDDDRYDDRAESFNSGSNYGRPAAYSPNNRQRSANRASADANRRSIPAQGGRSNYGAAGSRRPYDDDARYNAARRSARFEEDDRDFAPQQRPARARSRFEETDESAEIFNAPAQAPARRPAPNSGSTVMFSIRTLTDVNPVIKSLIRGDSIVMTLEADDAVTERRILDTLSGAVFALDATFRRPSKNSNTYLLAPKSVNIRTAYELED